MTSTSPAGNPVRPLTRDAVPWWRPTLLAALAGGLGWGIRGQYGHETGAMIAGLLVGLVLVLTLCPDIAARPAARAIAWGTVAIGFGGSMTYAQTIGLTHDAPLIGNWAALRWGMLGLAIKGALWFGFAGAFLGLGLGGVRYRPRELLAVMLVLIGLFFVGCRVLNSPFDPANKILPAIYFSDDWRWEPGAELKPRREVWGGMLFALAGLILYTGVRRRDVLARNLTLWGALGGAIGFPLGQSLQAWHAWNPEIFRAGWWSRLDPHLNWWNFMETTFGATAGAVLGFGLWLHRRRIAPVDDSPEAVFPQALEWALLGTHVALLAVCEFGFARFAEFYTEIGLVMGLIPVVAIAGGRWWPYALMLPITALPIAGKTLRQLAYRETSVAPVIGWIVYFVVPLALAVWAAIRFARRDACERRFQASDFVRPALLLATWLYFGLNFAFFRFPWPWTTWTSRTPNGIVFLLCALGLTVAALRRRTETSSMGD